MPIYRIDAFREQHLVIEFEAPDLKAAQKMCSDPGHEFDMSKGNAVIVEGGLLPEVYGVHPENLEQVHG